jgi:hypothetical protein
MNYALEVELQLRAHNLRHWLQRFSGLEEHEAYQYAMAVINHTLGYVPIDGLHGRTDKQIEADIANLDGMLALLTALSEFERDRQDAQRRRRNRWLKFTWRRH